jgi:hypothetical protein
MMLDYCFYMYINMYDDAEMLSHYQWSGVENWRWSHLCIGQEGQAPEMLGMRIRIELLS